MSRRSVTSACTYVPGEVMYAHSATVGRCLVSVATITFSAAVLATSLPPPDPTRKRTRRDPGRVDVPDAIDLRAAQASRSSWVPVPPTSAPSTNCASASIVGGSGSSGGSARTDHRASRRSPQNRSRRVSFTSEPRSRASCTPSHASEIRDTRAGRGPRARRSRSTRVAMGDGRPTPRRVPTRSPARRDRAGTRRASARHDSGSAFIRSAATRSAPSRSIHCSCDLDLEHPVPDPRVVRLSRRRGWRHARRPRSRSPRRNPRPGPITA